MGVVVVLLLVAILITLLGWWSVFGGALLIVGLLIGAFALVATILAPLLHLAERAREKEHARLVQSLPAVNDQRWQWLRDIAVWEWINKGRNGDLAQYVTNYERRCMEFPAH